MRYSVSLKLSKMNGPKSKSPSYHYFRLEAMSPVCRVWHFSTQSLVCKKNFLLFSIVCFALFIIVFGTLEVLTAQKRTIVPSIFAHANARA